MARSSGYLLEARNSQGSVVSQIWRRAQWFSDAAVPDSSGPSMANAQPRNVDQYGLILVSAMVPSDRWLDRSVGDNVHLEVLDPFNGTLLASERMNTKAFGTTGTVPAFYFPRTRLAYVRERSEAGIPLVRIVEYSLQKRTASGGENEAQIPSRLR
jgi:hypothetical protein